MFIAARRFYAALSSTFGNRHATRLLIAYAARRTRSALKGNSLQGIDGGRLEAALARVPKALRRQSRRAVDCSREWRRSTAVPADAAYFHRQFRRRRARIPKALSPSIVEALAKHCWLLG